MKQLRKMMMKLVGFSCVCVAILLAPHSVAAQSTATPPPLPTIAPSPTDAQSAVPRAINFNGQVRTATAEPRTGPALITFRMYADQTGGPPLWTEQHAVVLDSGGQYGVILGTLTPGGLPTDMFASGSGRWLGISVDAEAEQPRLMLLSVPYALKAADADTIAGKPIGDFVLTSNLPEKMKEAVKGTGADGFSPAGTNTSFGTGTPNRLAKFNLNGDAVYDSVVTDDGVSTISVADGFKVVVGNCPAAAGFELCSGPMRLNSRGVITNGFVDGLNMGTWDMFGYPVPGRDIAFGGYRANQWFGVGLWTAGAQRVYVDSAGNVGIGTSSPSAKLHVVGNGAITGNLDVVGNIAAKYQDVAEWVETSAPIESGTIVIVDPAHANRVIPAPRAYDSRIAGAVSKQPGLVLGEKGDTKAMVAQSGRVRVKVDARYGAIHIGDLLVTSPTPGYAMRSKPLRIDGQMIHRPGTILGKALEALPNGKGEILALLTLQ